MPLNVYLTFEDNCREVFDFYRSVFGGEYLIIQTFGDGPADMGILDSERDRIMHATISIGDSFLMGSDTASNFSSPPTAGDNFSLSYTSSSREEVDEFFARLSAGGDGDHAAARDLLGVLLWFLHRQVRHQLAIGLRASLGVTQARGIVYFPFAPVTGTGSASKSRSVLIVYVDVLQAPIITV